MHCHGYMAELDPTLGPGAMASPPPRLWVSRGCCTLVGLKIYLTTWVSQLILMEGRRADSYIKDPCGKSEVVRSRSTDRKQKDWKKKKHQLIMREPRAYDIAVWCYHSDYLSTGTATYPGLVLGGGCPAFFLSFSLFFLSITHG